MLHVKVAHVDASAQAGSQVARVGTPPARYAGVFYHFSDPTQTARITVQNHGNDVFQASGCSNLDALAPYDQTKQGFPVTGDILVVVDQLNKDSVGATLDISLLLDFGGAG